MSQTWEIPSINRHTTSPSSDIEKIVNGLNALQSVFSGSAEPLTPTALMWWADTGNGLLKQRSANNKSWMVRSTLGKRVLLLTSAYTVTVADFGKTILCDATTAPYAVTLNATLLGNGFYCKIVKIDSTPNIITINGAAVPMTLTQPYGSLALECNNELIFNTAPLLSATSTTSGTTTNKKGDDIVASNTLDVGNDETYFHVTGNTTVSNVSSRPAGTMIALEFDSELVLAQNTYLLLTDNANVSTQSGDIFVFISEGEGVWREVSRPHRIATSAMQVAGNDWRAYVTPGSQRLHLSAAKAWLSVTYWPGHQTLDPQITASYNISSVAITNNNSSFNCRFITPMQDASYFCMVTPNLSYSTGKEAVTVTAEHSNDQQARFLQLIVFGAQ